MSTSIMSRLRSISISWLFIGEGSVFGIPLSLHDHRSSIAAAWHVVLSRMRPGWRLTAVGGARRSAHNAGINVRLDGSSSTYVASGTMCALAGFLFAARLGSAGSDTGVGLEVQALTAAVLGGTAIGGGRGSVAKAIIGSLLVLLLTNGLINLGISGPITSTILGAVLLCSPSSSTCAGRSTGSASSPRSDVSPTYLALPPAPKRRRAGLALCAQRPPALGRDHRPRRRSRGRRTSSSTATTISIAAPATATSSASSVPTTRAARCFAHIGGHPLGMAFDRARQSARLASAAWACSRSRRTRP